MNQENNHRTPAELMPKYLAGETTAGENRIVEEWMAADEANRQEFEELSRVWNITAKVPDCEDIDIEAEWQRMETFLRPAGIRIINIRRILQIAASVVLISALAFAGLKWGGIKTEKASLAALSTVALPDGTKVFVNAGSKISYRKGFGIDHRNIILKGEAYFEVVRNAKVPFIVTAEDASIRVVGTKFNVRAYKDQNEIKVAVTEGKVRLFENLQPSKEALLNAGETGIFDRTMKTVKKQSSINLNDFAWKTRVIDFNNTSLAEVAGILENTYHQKVRIDPRIQNCTVTVRFENIDLASVLEVLQSTLDLSVSTEGKTIIIRGKGC